LSLFKVKIKRTLIYFVDLTPLEIFKN